MKTIKQYINDWFEEQVRYDEVLEVYNDQDFWRAWDKLDDDMGLGGIQWCFEWHMDQPSLTQAREKFIKDAVDNYIKTQLRPIYINY